MSLRLTSLQDDFYVESGMTRKVRDSRGLLVDKKQLLPRFQRDGRIYLPNVSQLPSTFSPTVFNQANVATSLIPKIDLIKHMALRVDVTVASAPVTLVPCNYWFRQLDIKDNGSGEIIQTHYGDTMHANFLNRVHVASEKALFKTANVESAANGKYGVTKPLPIGTHTFFIPLMTALFENYDGLYLADLQGDLSLTLTTNSTIIASGAGTITSAISFVVEGAKLTPADISIYRNRYFMNAAESRFLQPIQSLFDNVQLTAGASKNLKLDNVDGLCAFQMIMVRPTGQRDVNTGFAQWKLLNIGDSNGAAIDLVTNAGTSIWGNGNPVPTRYMRQHIAAEHFPNAWATEKPVYFINYCEDINNALRGKVEGARFFDSSDGDQIRLSLPAAPIAEVQTVTFSTTPQATGFYSFSYKGETSAELVGNANVAAMKAAIEGMKYFSSKYITVTCSAVASAGASFTITFSDPEGELTGDLVTVNSHDGLVASASTARTTAGVPGLASGQYDVTVYSYVYSEAYYSGKKLSSRRLVLA